MGLVQVRLSSACLRRGCFFLPLVERSSNHLGFVVLPANFHIQNRTRRRICWRHVGQGNVFAQSREGEPLVTTPMCSPAPFEQQYSSRAIPRSIISRPTSVRFNPAALERSSAARPIKSPFSI